MSSHSSTSLLVVVAVGAALPAHPGYRAPARDRPGRPCTPACPVLRALVRDARSQAATTKGVLVGLGRGSGARAAGVRSLALVVAATALLISTAPVPAAPAAPATRPVAMAQRAVAGGDGLRVESTTTYTLDVAATTVRVRYEVTLTNQSPDVVSGGFIRQRFFPEYGIGVLAEATNIVAAKADGTPLAVRTEATESPRFTLAIADLVPNLFHPNSQTLTITYDLPRLPPRSEGLTRINEAFATFPVYGVGDPGLTTVEVRIPDHMEVELIGSEMAKSEAEGTTVYRAEAIAAPEDFFVDVVARDDERLVRRAVDVADTEVVVLGWPDDPEWADFVASTVGDGVPVLADLVGIEWPGEDGLEVVETVAPYLYGYAGWFQPYANLIEVGDELDAQVILHELAHLWFNDALFAGRWINEALAEEFSTQALAELGEDPGAPLPVDPAGPGALRLNEWGEVDLQEGDTEAQEVYGYNTSWAVLRRVVDEVGLEPVAEAVQLADAHLLPYRADTVDTTLLRTPDWRTLLDLLEEVAGATTAEAVFRELVVTPAQAEQLDERAAARADYGALLEAGGGWAPPAELRGAMSDWRFDDATAMVPEVEALLEVRDDIASTLDDIGTDLPATLQESFEGARDLDELADLMGEAATASDQLRQASLDRDGATGPLAAVGLLFSSIDDDLDAARADLDDGDYEAAADRASAAQEAVDGATAAGAVRLAAVALLLLAGWFSVHHLRRRRRAAAVTASLPSADRSAWMAPEGPDPDGGALSGTEPPGSEPDGAEGVGRPPDGGGQAGV